MRITQVENGQVVRTIVANIGWARDTFGGEWVETGDLKPGPGWTYVDGEFRPVPNYPSWVWEDGAWRAPKPQPDIAEGGAWEWDETASGWVFFFTDDETA